MFSKQNKSKWAQSTRGGVYILYTRKYELVANGKNAIRNAS